MNPGRDGIHGNLLPGKFTGGDFGERDRPALLAA